MPYLAEYERTEAQAELLRQEAQQRAMALAKAKAEQTARAKLLGIPDPSIGGNWSAPNALVNRPMSQQIFNPDDKSGTAVGFTQYPVGNRVDSLMPPPEQLSGLMGGQDQFAAYQQRLRNQADPDYAMQMERLAPVIASLPPDLQNAVKMGGPKALETLSTELGKKYADQQYPTKLEDQRLQELRDSFPVGDPRRKTYEDLLAKKTYIPEMDPLKRQEMQANVDEKGAQTGLANQRAKMLESSGLDDDTLERLYGQYKAGQPISQIIGTFRGPAAGQQQSAFQNYVTKRATQDGLSGADFTKQMQDLKASTATLLEFDKGKAGTDVRRANTAVDHLLTLQKYGDALENGDMATANEIKNMFGREFNDANLSGYEGIAKVVGDEVNKYISGGPGASDDRAAYAKTLSSAKDKKARYAAIGGLTSLIGGQLSQYERQYRVGTGRNDFAERLSPETAAILQKKTEPAKAAAPAGGIASPISPELQKYVDQYKTPK